MIDKYVSIYIRALSNKVHLIDLYNDGKLDR